MTKQEKSEGYTLTLRFASGETVSRDVAKLPRHWRSWLMQQAPYGADYMGCEFSLKRHEGS